MRYWALYRGWLDYTLGLTLLNGVLCPYPLDSRDAFLFGCGQAHAAGGWYSIGTRNGC